NSHVENRRIDLDGFLAQHGFRVEFSIRSKSSVVVPAFGLVGTLPIYSQPQNTANLARLLASHAAADFTVYLEHERVLICSSRGNATIEAKNSGALLRYTTVDGDPLQLKPAMEHMMRQRELDAEGFSSTDNWFAATASHEYPDAVNAVYQG